MLDDHTAIVSKPQNGRDEIESKKGLTALTALPLHAQPDNFLITERSVPPQDIVPLADTMPATGSATSPSTEPQMQSSTERPLNVTDALTYLDQVKTKFQDNPEVYNRFLDIMKDFKSQIIDTPGVIERVSNLFHGHPTLIQGFNTFLPAGYRIECTTDALNPNFITVTTPAGTTTQATNGTFAFGLGAAGGSTPKVQKALSKEIDNPPPPVNLEPALAYLQQVKTRYANEPDKYRRFLEILNPKTGAGPAAGPQGHELRDLEQWAVAFLSAGYAQGDIVQRVGKLFLDAPGLMKDFVEFLPDKHAQEVELARLAELQGMRKAATPVGESSKASKKKAEEPSMSTSSTSGSTVPQKRKRKPADRDKDKEKQKEKDKEKEKEKEREKEKEKERDKDKESTSRAAPSKSKKSRASQAHPGEAPSPSVAQRHPTAPSSPRHPAQAHPSQPHAQHHPPPPPIAQPIPPPAVLPPAHPQPLSPADETQFFNRVERVLASRETYAEFLRLVNLFTQDIIDTARLVRESRSFLGDGELMAQFMEILGWDERRDRIAVAEDIWTRPMAALDRPNRNQLNIRHGSYRKLSPEEANVRCTGRDGMCNDVLNDNYISQPTFASEDGLFVTHRKNIYEEALHRSEEERHEYDFHIEAIHRTIGMLEPLNNKIAQLTPEERSAFKLKPNLGGAGKSVHLRVIKKIYGREAGQDVFQAVQDVPALAIPVVLARLKAKYEEWKRAQREWNKIWREVDAQNYHKSLDHQALTFKAADKKAITAKFFVSQIEVARDEQMAKRAALIDPLFARTRPRHQLEFAIENMPVLQDALKLTLSYLDRTQGQINHTDRHKIENFLRAFVPLFFAQDAVKFNNAFVPYQETVDSDVDSIADDVDGVNGTARTGRSNRKGTGAGDLRKMLLKSEQAKSSRRTRAQGTGSPSTSRLASPAASDVMPVDGEGAIPPGQDGEPAAVPSTARAENQRARRRYSFFTNNTYYVFLRLLEVLYSRLHHFKNLAAKIADDPTISHKPNSVAVDLGILNDFSKLGDRGTHAIHFYSLMLESCEKLFDNEIEPHSFEDRLRWMFGPKDAYKMFTVDKLVGAIVKQVQNVLLDVKSQELFELLRREREIASPTTQDQINARRNTENVIGPDETMFRLDWLPESKTMIVQLLGKDDSTSEDPEVVTAHWQAYMESFVSDEQTRYLPQALTVRRRPYLRRSRNLLNSPGTLPDIVAQGGLEIKVCVRTYRLFFVSNTEDVMLRAPIASEQDLAGERLRVKTLKRTKWLAQYLIDLDKTRTPAKEQPTRPTSPSASVAEGTPDSQEDVSLSERTPKQNLAPLDGPLPTDRHQPS